MSTVFDLIKRMLPNGSRGGDDQGNPSWELVPIWPPDVFAVVGTLMERASAYRQIIEPPEETGEPIDRIGLLSANREKELSSAGKCWAWTLLDTPDPETIEKLKETAPDLAETIEGMAIDVIHRSWSELVEDFKDEEIISRDSSETPAWWKSASRLLVAADIASSGIGFHTPPGQRNGNPTKVQFLFLRDIKERFKDEKYENEWVDRGVRTLTTELIDQSIASVLPKTRTSPLGCTLRSLTHNLALVPPSGEVEARWHVSGIRPFAAVSTAGVDDKAKSLNLLLVPFPYRIKPASFKVKSGPMKETGDWGYFELEQDWLNISNSGETLSQLTAFVQNLVQRGVEEFGEIHGVVFPEYSLNSDSYLAIAEALKTSSATTGFEFFIAGTSEEPVRGKRDSKKGNYAVFSGLGRPEEGVDPDWRVRGCREKHHRWKIDGSQIRRYGLASRLSPKSNWWEGIPVSRRILDFFEVRAGTSLTVLICEDLARADPCQAVVRSVGPNLVIALLMDGPQLPARWPGHYAGVLADDPGSSVLTMTSMGLIERASVTDAAHSRSIALFRDNRGNQRTLQLPHGCHALAVRLSASKKEEYTLDGRGDGNSAYVWALDEVVALRADDDAARPWIVGQ